MDSRDTSQVIAEEVVVVVLDVVFVGEGVAVVEVVVVLASAGISSFQV